MLRIRSNYVSRLTMTSCVGNDRCANLGRGAIINQSVPNADASYMRSAKRGARGGIWRKPLRVDVHVHSRGFISQFKTPKASCILSGMVMRQGGGKQQGLTDWLTV